MHSSESVRSGSICFLEKATFCTNSSIYCTDLDSSDLPLLPVCGRWVRDCGLSFCSLCYCAEQAESWWDWQSCHLLRSSQSPHQSMTELTGCVRCRWENWQQLLGREVFLLDGTDPFRIPAGCEPSQQNAAVLPWAPSAIFKVSLTLSPTDQRKIK